MPKGEPVLFFEPEFYMFSLFSAFAIFDGKKDFRTGEHYFQYQKFASYRPDIAKRIMNARSPHEAKDIAKAHKSVRDHRWEDRRLPTYRMAQMLRVDQHELVRAKLLSTGERRLIENSPDDFWGWGPGPNHRGLNHGGKELEGVRELLITRHN